MWARVHKLDRVRPQVGGGAIVLIEDERGAAQMQRVASLSTLVAIARVLAARRAIEARYDGKGEVYYATSAALPSFLSDAITRAGANVSDREGMRVTAPSQPAGVDALIDVAFSELAHYVRGAVGTTEVGKTLELVEQRRRAAPLDRDAEPERYWSAVLELSALAGELSRKRGGRWVATQELPLPFALKFPDGSAAHPVAVAQKIVDGRGAGDSLVREPTERPG
jgi:hypothetical protein